MKNNDLKVFLKWSISKLSEEFSKKSISPLEVTREILDRIHVVDKELNSYTTILEESALYEAKRAEEEITVGKKRGKLHGIPISLKDNIFTKNVRTTNASEIHINHVPKFDATVVKRLKEAGAILLGKSNMHQFAYGTTGDRSYFGPVRNSHNLSKFTGGSSSGSATSVATYTSYASIGTDTGGSVRIPASFEGIVGMKPTYGVISKYGVFSVCSTLDHVGPMTRTVEDNALLMNVLAGFDENDVYSTKKNQEDYTRLINSSIKEAIIGIPTNYYFENVDEEIKNCIDDAIYKFKQLGVQIKYIEIPNMEETSNAFWTTLKAEAYAIHENLLKKYPDKWDDEVKIKFYTGESVTMLDYIKSQEIKQLAIKNYQEIFSEVDALLTPTVPMLPLNIGQRQVMINDSNVHVGTLLNRCTGPTNLTGFPSLTLSAGFSNNEKLPIGFQLIGDFYAEANLYRLASAFESEN